MKYETYDGVGDGYFASITQNVRHRCYLVGLEEKEDRNMSKLNTAPKPDTFTHEGAPAKKVDAMAALRRSVCSAMLWEDEFYEDGVKIADRVQELAQQVPLQSLAALAHEVRTVHKLRHMPLLLLSVLALRGSGQSFVRHTIAQTLNRADELGEFLAVYAKTAGVKPSELKPALPAQVKKGVAEALRKFDAFQLARYDRDVAIKLKDVIRLTHPKPENQEQAAMWKSLLDGTLPTPDTWEVALSRGDDKCETFTRLLQDNRLGYLALLRNLRGMVDAGVDLDLIKDAIEARRGAQDVLPFRYAAAARACPQMEPSIDEALIASLSDAEQLPGKTIVLVDVSDSMNITLSSKSDLTRMDAAATLASIVTGDLRVFSFSLELVECPPRRGMAGVDAIRKSQDHRGTYLGAAITAINKMPHDRLIVVTDEQSHDTVPDPVAKLAYLINPASAKNGVGYRRWTHLDGFSENVIRFIHEFERPDDTE